MANILFNTLRNRYSFSFKVFKLQQLMLVKNQLGLARHTLKLDLDDFNKFKSLCLLF